MSRLVFLAVLVGVCGVVARGGDVARKGTTGADQLLIPVGARSIATGGAFLATTVGVEAIYYNPAGLAASPRSEAMFSYMSYIADINVSYFAASVRIEDLGTFGISYKTLDFGDIPITTFENPDGLGATYSPGFYTVGVSYAREITDRVSAGTNLKLVQESIMSTSATGVAMDFGVQYKFQRNLALGVTIKNVGSNMKYTGTDLLTRSQIPGTANNSPTGVYAPDTEPFQMPSYFELSATYRVDVGAMSALNVGSTFRNNNALEDQIMVGLEYQLWKTFTLRGGYERALENNNLSLYGFNFGTGLEYEFEGGLHFAFDYAFRSVREFPSDNHVFTLRIGF